MAEGLINVNSAVAQEQLAREQLDDEFAPHMKAAGAEAEDLPGLGRRLQHEWGELVKLAGKLPEANKAIAGEVETAHRVMTGGHDTPEYGVPLHAQEFIQGPQGGERLSGRARRAMNAVHRLAAATPDPAEWNGAYLVSDGARQRIGALGSLVTNVIASTAKVPKDRFGALTKKAADASHDLEEHIGKL